ncbi:hypothetical protein [Nonomuraea maritima]|uniref:hypothetical protein n=1 Tax=Nonomuraea maritima TaxID=683260 RepID=UPI00115FC6E8|nr:hypothetical protein [Nonomuraea maritima]
MVLLLVLFLLVTPPVPKLIRKLSNGKRMGAYIVAVAALVVIIAWSVLQVGESVGLAVDLHGTVWRAVETGGVIFGAGASVYGVLSVAVLVAFRIVLVRTISWHLRAGKSVRLPKVYGRRARRRILYLSAAQHGNITLYSTKSESGDDDDDYARQFIRSPFNMLPDDPAFLGAGPVARVWSISAELDRQGGEGRVEEPIDIDPVELHAFVTKRLESMRDQVRNESESIRGLTTHHHVIARGLIARPGASSRESKSQSLVDQRCWLPYSVASDEAVNALIRHPQAGLRHYRLVMVGSERGGVTDATGRQIAAEEDQEVVISAFIHLAVEGRMLYTEFVSTVLPPVRPEFHVVDQMPRGPLAYIVKIPVTPLRSFFGVLLGAPVRFISVLLGGLNFHAIVHVPRFQVMYDYGAHKSVRELGAHDELSFTQRLDAFKYTKIISQRLTEAVVDFLQCKGVNTESFRQQASSIITTTSINIYDSQFGDQVAIGNAGPVNQSSARPQSPSGGQSGAGT